MPNTIQWIGRNLSLGGIIRNVGSLIGTIINFLFKIVGTVFSQLPKDLTAKDKIKKDFDLVGQSLDVALTKGSEVIGNGINKTVQVVSTKVGQVMGGLAKVSGASEDNIVFAKKLGTVAGAVVVGAAVGAGIADIAVALSAATGTAGAAATTSGLAGLGGGSIVAGGAGMAGGQVVTETVTALSTLAATASLNSLATNKQKEKN